ncbi:MAG: LLM class F420-dependent oxidoreductase [Gammaproteobacteria bacterium]|jgi:probable F420-dependent oxidoreductase|nr:LLM class F420-dependent oxidoreductase [Gammaproteobacteria bacterium]
MRIGVFSIQPDAAADPAIVAKHAEEVGFSSYWVPDHIVVPVHYSTPYPGNPGGGPDPDYLWQMPDPLITLMRAATATSTIEIGTGVLLVPERHPLHLAKEIASLDHFSGGRFQFGIGAGWNKEESEMLGGDFEHRWTQVREAIEVMKQCWTEHDSEHHGDYYDFPAVRCYPKPSQEPHPPIYLGGIMFGGKWAKRVFHRIVKWGDGWLPAVQNIEQVRDGWEQLEALALEAGRDPGSIRVRVFGTAGQWRKRHHVDAFAKVGVEEITIWLQEPDSDGIRRELDLLARELL